MAETACAVSTWMASTSAAMFSVAFAVSWASSLTSPATTAKPLPASPARAASIVALSASRLVCSAMDVIVLTTSPISCGEVPSLGAAELPRRGPELGDGRGGSPRDLHRAPGDLGRLGGVVRDLVDRGAHLLRARGDGLHVAGDLLGRRGDRTRLGRGLLGAGGDRLRGPGELLGCGGQALRRLP